MTVPDPLAGLDRGAVPPRLLPTVDAAVAAAYRFRALVGSRPAGPVRERLVEMSRRVDAGAVAVYEAALHARQLDEVAATLDADAVTAAYKDLRRRADADPALLEAARARFESTQRVLNARDGLGDRLELLRTRLEASVARAAEVAVLPDGDVAAEADLAAVTDELAALRAGLDAVR